MNRKFEFDNINGKLDLVCIKNIFLKSENVLKDFSYIYLETSAVNFFANIFEPSNAEKKITHASKEGLNFRTSSLVFWEILNTTDDLKREKLIFFMQHFMPFPLLASPEELLVNWLEQQCPLKEKRRELISKTDISVAWSDILTDKRKTFVIDRQQLADFLKLQRKLGKSLRNTIQNENGHIDELLGVDLKVTLDPLINKLSFINGNSNVAETHRQLYRLAMFFALMILCAGLTIEREPIEHFWQKRKIDDNIVNRLLYVLNHLEESIYRGPFANMAIMAVSQSVRRHSRGLWMDCLHSVYLPYSDIFISADQHFAELKEKDKLFSKIIMAEDFSKTRQR